jgi:hypothetical protein
MNVRNKFYILHYLVNKRLPRLCFFLVLSFEKFLLVVRLRKKKKLIFVYGEPRSGTSFITALINRMGFYPGPYVWLLNANQFNPDGYFECVPFQSILDEYIVDQGFNFENRLPEKPSSIPKNLRRKIKLIIEGGNLELLKYNKFSLYADEMAELFPEALWIHVFRNEEEVYKSNFKFMGGRDRVSFFKNYHQRVSLWNQSKISKRSFEINFSDLKQKEDVLQLINNLCKELAVILSEKEMDYCLKLFRPKENRRTS